MLLDCPNNYTHINISFLMTSVPVIYLYVIWRRFFSSPFHRKPDLTKVTLMALT